MHITLLLIAFPLSLHSTPTHTNISSSHKLSLLPLLSISHSQASLSLSSDFPVVHGRAADQYIITGFEAYIYYRSGAINAVISLPPLTVPSPSASSRRFAGSPAGWDNYAVEVKLNDYLDIVCPHYPQGEVPLLDAERYVLYMVEREDYESCKPQSYDQMRWECGHPFAPHAPEKFSEKFQRFTPFTLGKEFRQGESYYYICKCHCSSLLTK